MKLSIKYLLLIVLPLTITNLLANNNNRYIPIENKYYSFIEYQVLKSDSISIFVLNQPYKFSELENLNSSESFKRYYNNYVLAGFSLAKADSKNISVAADISPGLMAYSDQNYQEISRAIHLDGTINIKSLTLVNRIKLDPSVKYDPDFHGDTGEWLMGYFQNSYLNLNLDNYIDIFAGRLGRNFGILNDYGLILSHNPYNFDHFGFRAGYKSLQYSFYFTRLNDMLGIDSQGAVFPIGETLNCHRYWAIQKLDWALLPDLQISLSEATIYGGPEQDYVPSYLSPVNFFYASQRNQQQQMSGLWQIAAFYRPKQGLGLYLDLFADDLVVNNEPVDDFGTMPTDVYPQRLGVMAKISCSDLFFKRTLSSLRYVRIWNDTYISARNFENYIYFNKSLGFPMNSYEGVKLSNVYFLYPSSMFSLSIETWRHGDRELTDVFKLKKEKFPAGDVLYGLDINISCRTIFFKNVELDVNYNVSLTNLTFKEILTPAEVDHRIQAKLYYHFMRSFSGK